LKTPVSVSIFIQFGGDLENLQITDHANSLLHKELRDLNIRVTGFFTLKKCAVV